MRIVMVHMLKKIPRDFDNNDKADSEVQQLRRRVAESSRSLDTMMRLASVASDIEQSDEFIAETMRLMCGQTSAVLAVAWMYNYTEQKLDYRLHVDMQRIETAELIDVVRSQRIEPDNGSISGRVFINGVAESIEALDGEQDLANKMAMKAGLRAAFALPIRNKYRVIGVLEFFSRKPLNCTEHQLQFFNELGAFVGIQSETKMSDERLRDEQAREEALQEELRRTADQAIQSARLKSEFVANVSHEVRTPLAGIMGMAEMLASKENIDEETKDLAGYILASAHSLLAIVNDLLDFSKLEAGKLSLYKTSFSVPDVIESIARSARASADKKGLMVRTRVDDRLPENLFGDGARLTQILMNFAHNAVKFTDRGEINIGADFESMLGNTLRVRFSVSDTGIGINETAQKKLFEPFVQADGSTTRRFGGTGLGLSIARKLTQLMGGDIALDSEEGIGSTFYVIVPLELDIEQMVG
jgi:signal transduction histidine kinase